MKRILIVGPAWVGDMVMAQSLFKLLKQTQSCRISVLAPVWTAPLLERMLEVDEVLLIKTQHGQFDFMLRFRMAQSIRKKKFDQAILLTNSFKSALIPFLARIPIRTSWLGEFRYGLINDVRIRDKINYPLMIQQFALLGLGKSDVLPEHLPYPQLNTTVEEQGILKAKFKFTDAKKILVLAPGAEYGPAKRWPAKYFSQVAEIMSQKKWLIIILGSPKDLEIANQITAGIQKEKTILNLVGQTNLTQAIDILAMADAVISNDSGLMHVAAAFNTFLIAIYGSSAPTFTPPLSSNAKIISLQLQCSPCFQRVCPLEHFKCLNELKPEYVLEKLYERFSLS